MGEITQNKYYLLVILLVVMPINIYFMFSGKLALGIILSITQVPYLYGVVMHGFRKK